MTSQKMHSFSHRTINDWNDLPKSVGVVDTINSFKSLLEKHWKEVNFKFECKCYVQVEDVVLNVFT